MKKRNLTDASEYKRHRKTAFLLLALLLIGYFVCLFLLPPLIYPRHYRGEVERACAEFSVPESLVYAVMRTESGFDPSAVSAVGARGLMQLMPSTFSFLLGMLGEEYQASDIDEPPINIRFGVFYLSYLYAHFSSWDIAIMAYNAGPGAVDKWQQEGRLEANSYDIPYPETEAYFYRVKNAVGEYKRIYGGI